MTHVRTLPGGVVTAAPGEVVAVPGGVVSNIHIHHYHYHPEKYDAQLQERLLCES